MTEDDPSALPLTWGESYSASITILYDEVYSPQQHIHIAYGWKAYRRILTRSVTLLILKMMKFIDPGG